MTAHRVWAKLFLTPPDHPVDRAVVVRVFHRWIQEGRLAGGLIDVADYRHVVQWPSVLLVTDDGYYALDDADGRAGVRFELRRPGERTFAARIAVAVERATAAAVELGTAPELGDGVAFDGSTVELGFVDRRAIPHSDAGLAVVASALTEVLGARAGARWHPVPHDRRGPLRVIVQREATGGVAGLTPQPVATAG